MSLEERYAPLTAGLLARKGDAEPALEPFAHARVAESARQMAPGSVHKLDRRQGEPKYAEFHHPQHPAVRAPESPRAADVATTPAAKDLSRQEFLKRRAAVTFRMATHDFLRLKLASAELESSCQNIILAALETYLDSHGVERLDDCKCLREADRLSCEARACQR